MLPIPDDILKSFDAIMEEKAISISFRADYRKWIMYYLDFRIKYPPPDSRSEQVRLFIEKLRSKNQSQKKLEQAAHASLGPSENGSKRKTTGVTTRPPLDLPARRPTLTPAPLPEGEGKGRG